MAKVIQEKEYLVEKDFEALIELSSEEYNSREASGKPGPKVTARSFVVKDDCTVMVNGMTVALKAKEKLTDIGLAFNAVRQAAPLAIKEKQVYTEGQLISEEETGESLLDAGHPVKAQAKGTAAKAEEPTPAEPAPTKEPEKAKSSAKAGGAK